jgi:PAS domain S-box-containing protein
LIWVAGADTLCTFVNKAWLDFTGRTLEHELGDDWLEGVHPDDAERCWQTYQSVFAARQEYIAEYRPRRADDKYHWILDSGRPWYTPCDDFAGHTGSCIDITDRKEVEEQYREIFEATSDGLIINDANTGVIVDANPAACQMYGYTSGEFIGLHPAPLTHPDDRGRIEEYFQRIQRGESFETEGIGLRKGGTPFHVAVHGTPIMYRGKRHALEVVCDVTERVETFQLLEQRVQERTREPSTLIGVSHTVASTVELEPRLGLILDQLKHVADYAGATNFTIEGSEARILAYRGPASVQRTLGLQFSLEHARAIWDVLIRRQPVMIPDILDDSPLACAFRAALGSKLESIFSYVRSWLAVPLILQEELIGLLSISWHEPDHFTSRQAELVLALASQAAVAIGNARLYGQARTLAALQERQRLARELHDPVSQMLYSIALSTRTARILLDRDPAQVGDVLDDVLSLAKVGLAEMRALIFELRPESLETEGIVAALTKQAASLRVRHDLDVETDLCPEPELPLETKEELYRIAQETLHNIVKHAQTSRGSLQLADSGGDILLEVRDNRIGFDPAVPFPRHLGLRSMRERANRLRGSLDIEGAPNEGTRITVRYRLRASR